MPISARTLFTAEVIFNRLRYDKVTNEYWGTDDPTTSNDERSHYTATENTKARLFDVPLLLHRNVRATGMLSHLYLSGGVTVRNASSVRTINNITNADGTLGNNPESRSGGQANTARRHRGRRFPLRRRIQYQGDSGNPLYALEWPDVQPGFHAVAAQPVGSRHRLQPLAAPR